jgi:hypothetical protein
LCQNKPPLRLGRVMMKRLPAFLPFLFVCLVVCLPGFAKTKKAEEPLRLSPKILEAKSVYLDCDCRREMAASVPNALFEMRDWGRYQISPDAQHADLVLLFSMHKYLGDYLTRDGPDKRPATVDYTVLTVIDARTGEALWSDWKRWGYMLVARASRALIRDFRLTVAEDVKSWTLEDVQSCRGTPAYALFANRTPEEVLAESEFSVAPAADISDPLTLDVPMAPDFCKRARLIVGPENKVLGFEVLPAGTQTLDVAEIMLHANQFDFSGEKNSDTGNVSFTAQSKDRKLRIEYSTQGRLPILTRVEYLF